MTPDAHSTPVDHSPSSDTGRAFARLDPVVVTFIASLVLSLIACAQGALNRDGVLYVRTAQSFLNGGFAAAEATYNWPFLPIIMAAVSQATGLGLETAGHVINALSIAGACALLVSCIKGKQPDVAWAACLTVLALPGINEYRDELLREYGYWFFVMLSIWLALRWSEQPGWVRGIGVQLSVCVAALFRPEALVLLPILLLWQLFASSPSDLGRRLAMIGILPAAAAVVVALHLNGKISLEGRLALDLTRISFDRFDAKAKILASGLILDGPKEAKKILLMGSLSIIPLQLLSKLGVFVLPLGTLFVLHAARKTLALYPLFAWGIVAQLLVLAIFVIDVQFLAGRYVGLTLLLLVPFLANGALLLLRHFGGRWRGAVIIGALLLAVANVVSLSPAKTQFLEAGQWLSRHAAVPERTYIDSSRTAYYAGWFNVLPEKRGDRSAIEQALRSERYDRFVLEMSRTDSPTEAWIAEIGLDVVEKFPHSDGSSVVIAVPARRQH